MNCSSNNNIGTNTCTNCNREFTTKIGLKLHLRKCKPIQSPIQSQIQTQIASSELSEVDLKIKKELTLFEMKIKKELEEVKSCIEMFNIINIKPNFIHRNDINSSFYIKYLVEKYSLRVN